jgi:hypothetical protein
MQMVLDALESFESGTNGLYKGEFAEERKALRDRLEQPEREWIGLTDEEIGLPTEPIQPNEAILFARVIEALLKEKNS